MKRLLASAAALSLLAAGVPAAADHGHNGKAAAKAHKKAVKAHRKAVKEAQKAWRKGQYMPAEHRHHYIADISPYGLQPPPPGYRWVLVEDDAYLVQRENGLIRDIIWSVVGR